MIFDPVSMGCKRIWEPVGCHALRISIRYNSSIGMMKLGYRHNMKNDLHTQYAFVSFTMVVDLFPSPCRYWCRMDSVAVGSGAVTFTPPLLGLISTLYLHQLWLYKEGDCLKCLKISSLLGDCSRLVLILVVLFILTQSKEEVVRVTKVLPVLWLGIGLMDWVLLVCIQQLIGQQWDE